MAGTGELAQAGELARLPAVSVGRRAGAWCWRTQAWWVRSRRSCGDQGGVARGSGGSRQDGGDGPFSFGTFLVPGVTKGGL